MFLSDTFTHPADKIAIRSGILNVNVRMQSLSDEQTYCLHLASCGSYDNPFVHSNFLVNGFDEVNGLPIVQCTDHINKGSTSVQRVIGRKIFDQSPVNFLSGMLSPTKLRAWGPAIDQDKTMRANCAKHVAN